MASTLPDKQKTDKRRWVLARGDEPDAVFVLAERNHEGEQLGERVELVVGDTVVLEGVAAEVARDRFGAVRQQAAVVPRLHADGGDDALLDPFSDRQLFLDDGRQPEGQGVTHVA